MDNGSFDISLDGIWNAWGAFRRGKKISQEIIVFESRLLNNLFELQQEISSKTYHHGEYRHIEITEKKRRDLAIASIRDRVAHRLLYDYLVGTFDRRFVFDVWSCREGRGLGACIERTQKLLHKNQRGYFWRSDIVKFFDHVRHDVLVQALDLRIENENARWLLKQVINSFQSEKSRERVRSKFGIPIGNVTSQIFANIYLNEFDRFVHHILKPSGYVRYGDDFIMFADKREKLFQIRASAINFLYSQLGLSIHKKSDILFPVRRGVHFLGMEVFQNGRRLCRATRTRSLCKINFRNSSSYIALVLKQDPSFKKQLLWSLAHQYGKF